MSKPENKSLELAESVLKCVTVCREQRESDEMKLYRLEKIEALARHIVADCGEYE